MLDTLHSFHIPLTRDQNNCYNLHMKVPVKIPQNVEMLIEAGQRVDFTTPLLKSSGKKTIEIPIAEIMRFSPDKIFLKLTKTIGDRIQQGDLLAEDKGMFGSKRYFSQIDGILKEINHMAGALLIEQDGGEADVKHCFFTGEVEAIYDGYLDLKVKNAHKVETQDPVEYIGAEVFYSPQEGALYVEEDINGKCIVTSELNPMDHSKIEALGARGVISVRKFPSMTLTQIILHKPEDFEIILSKRYPFVIVGPEENTLYFYE